MAAQRKMERFLFWLNTTNEEESLLADTISTLKKERSFARTIRQGIQLIVALRQRDTSLLFELFPWLKDELVPADIPANKRHDDSLRDQLKRLETLIVQQGSVPMEGTRTLQTTLSPVSVGNAKTIAGAVDLAAPDLDFDFDIEIKKDEGAAARSSENLRRTLMAMYKGEGVWASK
jgi:hypothetical protein